MLLDFSVNCRYNTDKKRSIWLSGSFCRLLLPAARSRSYPYPAQFPLGPLSVPRDLSWASPGFLSSASWASCRSSRPQIGFLSGFSRVTCAFFFGFSGIYLGPLAGSSWVPCRLFLGFSWAPRRLLPGSPWITSGISWIPPMFL